MRTTNNGAHRKRKRRPLSKAEATLKRAAERYQAMLDAVTPAAEEWYGQRNERGTPADLVLARFVRAYVKAHEHLEGLLGSRPKRRKK